MTQQQLSLAKQILSLKQQYEAIVASAGGSLSASQTATLNSLHQQALFLSAQLQNSGYTGPQPESQSAAQFAATLASYQSASGGSTSSSNTSSSSASGSGATAITGGFSQFLGSTFGGIGQGINTVTGQVGQARAAAWIAILIPFIVVLALAGFVAHHLSVAYGNVNAKARRAAA